jgi:hypothetical protein
VLGDPARRLVLEARDAEGRPVEPLAGEVEIGDGTVVALDGLEVRPRSPGSTMVTVFVGDHSARAGVEVFERVPTLDGLRPEQRLVAVPLRLASGEVRRWRIAAGAYAVTIIPDRRTGRAPRLAVEGANCAPMLGPRYLHCLAGSDAALIAYHPWRAEPAPALTGDLAVRRLGDLPPADAAALRR